MTHYPTSQPVAALVGDLAETVRIAAAPVRAAGRDPAATVPDCADDADQDEVRSAVRRLVARMRADSLWLRRDPTDRDGAILVRATASASLGAGRVRWSLVEAALAQGLLTEHGGGRIGVPLPQSHRVGDAQANVGRARDRQQGQEEDGSSPRDGTANAPESPIGSPAESPLAWLRRRRGADGQPLIDAAAFLAGERLRRDVMLAALLPSVTQNWARADGPGAGGGFDPAAASDATIAARQRVRAVYRVLGTRMGDFLVDVCGFLLPLQDAERRRGWPARSGKVVLALALGRLAAHYGLSNEARGADGEAGTGEAGSRRRHVWHAQPGPASVRDLVARREACDAGGCPGDEASGPGVRGADVRPRGSGAHQT